MKRTVVVAGVSSDLGPYYLERFRSTPGTKCIAVSRRLPAERLSGVEYVQSDLSRQNGWGAVLSNRADEFVLVHLAGMFRFEPNGVGNDHDGDGIDDLVKAANYDTLLHSAGPVLDVIARSPGNPLLRICSFGSVSDKYDVPFWRSYTRSTNLARRYVRTLSGLGSGLFVNTSTIDTESARSLNPNGDKTYWLRPEEVVDATLSDILELRGWLEVDVYRKRPGFDPARHYGREAVAERWG